jgi:hypothetical protein
LSAAEARITSIGVVGAMLKRGRQIVRLSDQAGQAMNFRPREMSV